MIKRLWSQLEGFGSAVDFDGWVHTVLLMDVDVRQFLRLEKTAVVVHVLHRGIGDVPSEVRFVIISNEPGKATIYSPFKAELAVNRFGT